MAIEWFKMKKKKWWHGQAFFHKQEAKQPKGKGSRSPSTWHNFQHQTRTTHECHTQFHHDHYKSNIEKQITWGWQLLHLGCHKHPSYLTWAHNPEFHRTETWLFFTFLFPRLFPLINLVCTSRVPYLVIFRPITDWVFIAWWSGPFPSSVIDIECVPIRLTLLMNSLTSRHTSASLNSEDTLYPVPLDNPVGLTL